ncbi:hypothetical protein [Photobacterium damselae]|uniref:hypothetical protein n=1 Tax=Photobacterium damselae TaxID=38293 RepID=UPI00406783CC
MVVNNGQGIVQLKDLSIGKINKTKVCDKIYVLYSDAWDDVNIGDNVMFDAKLMINSEIQNKKYNGKTRYQKEISRYVNNYKYLFYLTYVTSVIRLKRIFSVHEL